MTEDALIIINGNNANSRQTEVNDAIEKAFKGIRNEDKKFEIAEFDFGKDDFDWG
ncbi:MAG: hypothetical protein AAGF81_10750 [Pseudomonadota bacterium]